MSNETSLPPVSPVCASSFLNDCLCNRILSPSSAGDRLENEKADVDSMTASTMTDTAIGEIETCSTDMPFFPSLEMVANSAANNAACMSRGQPTKKEGHSFAEPAEIAEQPREEEDTSNKSEENEERSSFLAFRIHYLIVHIAIMLADGLQGTHLYVLYEGYGYTVASLYCLGFLSGAATSPFIGPIVDYKLGRRAAAVIYCLLEIAINMAEQHEVFAGLVFSRIVGGITTNLLYTVFESWLVTEHRKRGFSEDKLEIILRDSVVASNLSAIASGCLAHVLAEKWGNCGPFSGAVGCTFVALVLVGTRWEENFGSVPEEEQCATNDEKGEEELVPGIKSIQSHMGDALSTIFSDSKISRIGIIQGLSEGALQTFVFLWSPALRHFALNMPSSTSSHVIGIASDGEPTYGLIFGAFMACGALGGMCEPSVRKQFVSLLQREDHKTVNGATPETVTKEETDRSSKQRYSDSSASQVSCLDNLTEEEKPVAVEFLASACFFICALLLSTPIFVDPASSYAFSVSLIAFLFYEFFVGLYMPCEGVIRSMYMPNDSICSIMTMLRVIVNVSVALGVISTNYISFTAAFAACSGSLIVASILQLSLVRKEDWGSILSIFGFSSSHQGKIVIDGYPIIEMDKQLQDMPVAKCLHCIKSNKYTKETSFGPASRTSQSTLSSSIISELSSASELNWNLERNSLQREGLRQRIAKLSNQ